MYHRLYSIYEGVSCTLGSTVQHLWCLNRSEWPSRNLPECMSGGSSGDREVCMKVHLVSVYMPEGDCLNGRLETCLKVCMYVWRSICKPAGIHDLRSVWKIVWISVWKDGKIPWRTIWIPAWITVRMVFRMHECMYKDCLERYLDVGRKEGRMDTWKAAWMPVWMSIWISGD